MLTIAGAALLTASGIGLMNNRPKAIIRKQLVRYFRASKMPEVTVKDIKKKGSNYTAKITLPYGLPLDRFQDHLPGIEQAVATPIKLKHVFGSTCELVLGYAPFYDSITYNEKLPKDGLTIPLFTPFGLKKLDFSDETCCHLLTGGATRMGKSALIRLIATHLTLSTDGNIVIKMLNNKVTDLYMFRNIPHIEIAETSHEAQAVLELVLEEARRRKALLKSKKDVVDIKQFRQRYPKENVPPMFVIVDEYGRFADDKGIQSAVTELAETAGYLDIHLIVTSQRPDAKDVLKPRIKANILTRIAFSTTDETNSNIILDAPDAAHLGKIQGRALLLDGFLEKVQVPYISPDQAIHLLEPYRKDDEIHDAEGPTNNEVVDALPSFIKGSIGFTDLS
jgi:hypothetical protein